MKEVIISTGAVNSYGTRILTAGIDLEQYRRNPVLLWMHRRSYKDTVGPIGPIGRIENLRCDGDKLIGTPVFDQNDPFAKQVESKWENGFLRMASAGLEPLEVSDDPTLVFDGQTRATVTRSKLVEVSIVDIGSNDEALQLYKAGKLLTLAAGEEHPALPMLKLKNTPVQREGEEHNNQLINDKMNKEFLTLLGLPETATEEQAVASLRLLKIKADQVETIQLAAVTAAVDTAISEKRIVAENRDHFIALGKSVGLENLTATLKLMPSQHKPTEVIKLCKESAPGAGAQPKEYAKLSEVPEQELLTLRKENPAKYNELFKAEYGVDRDDIKD